MNHNAEADVEREPSTGTSVQGELQRLRDDALVALSTARERASVERALGTFLGRKGKITLLLKTLGEQPVADRPRLGQLANAIKREVAAAARERLTSFSEDRSQIDPTLPGEHVERGHLHPLTQFSRRMLEIWRSLGYDLHEGPELELDWYNFEALNIPNNHPSRDIHDTFFIKDHPRLLAPERSDGGQADLVLRTHTSTVQLRALRHRKPPLKYVEIGRVYRHEATDATHESMFTNCDGIVLDQNLTVAHLVGTLRTFLKALFGESVKIQVRPGYFPFVEPGIEIFMEWTTNGKTRWLEMLGAGMVHPNVIRAMKLDPEKWKGFAFGIGVDRLMMLYFGIHDVRLSYSGNLDFLKQF